MILLLLVDRVDAAILTGRPWWQKNMCALLGSEAMMLLLLLLCSGAAMEICPKKKNIKTSIQQRTLLFAVVYGWQLT